MQKGFSLIFILIGVLILGGVGFGGYYFYQQQQVEQINSFEECSKKYPVMTSYPGQCNTPDGRHFVQELSAEEKQKLVPPVESPENSQEKTDWKIFTNTKYPYQISYPSNWGLKDYLSPYASYDQARTLAIESPCDYDKGGSCGRLIISFTEKSNSELKTNLVVDDKNKILSDKKISLSGYPAREFIYYNTLLSQGNGLFGQLTKYVLVDYPNHGIILEYTEENKKFVVSDPEQWFYKKDLEEMLNSFKFLN